MRTKSFNNSKHIFYKYLGRSDKYTSQTLIKLPKLSCCTFNVPSYVAFIWKAGNDRGIFEAARKENTEKSHIMKKKLFEASHESFPSFAFLCKILHLNIVLDFNHDPRLRDLRFVFTQPRMRTKAGDELLLAIREKERSFSRGNL